MSVIVPNMKLPVSCFDCYFCTAWTGRPPYCTRLSIYIDDEMVRYEGCPLEEVPDNGKSD